jgi:Ni/Co efflux regulator RcnB
MKRLICAASALTLVLSGIAEAQPSGTQSNSSSQQRPSRDRPNRPRPPVQLPGPPAQRPRPPAQRPRPPSHRWRGRPPHFRPIRGPRWHYPRGWSHRRWHRGSFLPHMFLTTAFIWTHWASMGLYPPPHGFVWVRWGPDLLLVNRHTGQVRDVIHGAFF